MKTTYILGILQILFGIIGGGLNLKDQSLGFSPEVAVMAIISGAGLIRARRATQRLENKQDPVNVHIIPDGQ